MPNVTRSELDERIAALRSLLQADTALQIERFREDTKPPEPKLTMSSGYEQPVFTREHLAKITSNDSSISTLAGEQRQITADYAKIKNAIDDGTLVVTRGTVHRELPKPEHRTSVYITVRKIKRKQFRLIINNSDVLINEHYWGQRHSPEALRSLSGIMFTDDFKTAQAAWIAASVWKTLKADEDVKIAGIRGFNLPETGFSSGV